MPELQGTLNMSSPRIISSQKEPQLDVELCLPVTISHLMPVLPSGPPLYVITLQTYEGYHLRVIKQLQGCYAAGNNEFLYTHTHTLSKLNFMKFVC